MGEGALSTRERFDRIEAQLNTVISLQQEQATRSRVDFTRLEHHEKRIAEIEGWMKWGGRIVLALVITAVIGMVIVST